MSPSRLRSAAGNIVADVAPFETIAIVEVDPGARTVMAREVLPEANRRALVPELERLAGDGHLKWVTRVRRPVCLDDRARRRLVLQAVERRGTSQAVFVGVLPRGAPDLTEARKTRLGEILATLTAVDHDAEQRRLRTRIAELERECGERDTRIRELSLQASDVAAAKSQFLANTSHELRTPLNGILGMAESLLEDGESISSEQRLGLEMIYTSGKNLLALINDLLNYAKVEQGAAEADPGPIHARQLVENTIATLQATASEHGVHVEVDVPDTARIWADERHVTQALINLLANAVKFTPRGASVGIKVRARDDGRIHLIVWDQGVGVAPERRASLFLPFVQADGGLTREHTGTGLGLAMVKELVTLNEGEVWLDDSSELGSSFIIALPACEGEVYAAVPTVAPPAAVTTGTYRALLGIEADLDGKTMHDFLEWKGLGVSSHADAESIEGAAASGQIDIVVLDADARGFDAVDAVHRLKASGETARLPVLALTTITQNDDGSRYYEAGFDGFLPKPVDLKRLLATIEALCIASAA